MRELPKTKDGVEYLPGMPLYEVVENLECLGIREYLGGNALQVDGCARRFGLFGWTVRVADCFSSRAAAEQAIRERCGAGSWRHGVEPEAPTEVSAKQSEVETTAADSVQLDKYLAGIRQIYDSLAELNAKSIAEAANAKHCHAVQLQNAQELLVRNAQLEAELRRMHHVSGGL